MSEDPKQELYFQYYVASFYCLNLCFLWHEMGEEGLLLGEGKLSVETPSPDEIANIISDLALDDIVRYSDKEFGERKQALEDEIGESYYEWLFHLESEAKSLVDDHICDRYLFNIMYLYYAFLAQVLQQFCAVVSKIASQVATLEVHRAQYAKLLEKAERIESELTFVEGEFEIGEEKAEILNKRGRQFSGRLALSWRESLDKALANR